MLYIAVHFLGYIFHNNGIQSWFQAFEINWIFVYDYGCAKNPRHLSMAESSLLLTQLVVSVQKLLQLQFQWMDLLAVMISMLLCARFTTSAMPAARSQTVFLKCVIECLLHGND